jgi:16S rRNA (guanine966-N2)-methyltransferase
MRIIAGILKGRKLASVPGLKTRPTADRVREALFNILGQAPVGAVVLDLYAGTGALGIEALSRGSRWAVFVDHAREATAILDKNLQTCAMRDQARIIKWNIAKNLNCLKGYAKTFTLVFIDPPYRMQMVLPTLSSLARAQCLSDGALIVVEHGAGETLEPVPEPFRLEDQRRYGQTWLTFLIQPNPRKGSRTRITTHIYRWTPE